MDTLGFSPHRVLALDSPGSIKAVIQADGAVDKGIPKPAEVHWGKGEDLICLRHLSHHALVLEDTDVKVIRAHQELVPAVPVDITEGHCSNIVSRDGPELFSTSRVVALYRAVASDKHQG
jgi:hypothetical protein